MKLADFGLATTDRYTSDFGCGSTFYMSPECQQSPPRCSRYYASAPNDVWSLGIILVNLTCGRNPWKRASFEDCTFRAFLEDPTFLRSILPLSAELSSILRRVFERDPSKRISIHELRDLIVACPRLTTSSHGALPPSPPIGSHNHHESYDCADLELPPSPPVSPPPQKYPARPPAWSLVEATSIRSSASSSSSASSNYHFEATCAGDMTALATPFNFYGNVIPYSDVAKKSIYHQQAYNPMLVTAY